MNQQYNNQNQQQYNQQYNHQNQQQWKGIKGLLN